MTTTTAFFLFLTVVLIELLIVVTVTVAPHFTSSYAKTRVGAVIFFLMSAVGRFVFIAHARSNGIELDDYGDIHLNLVHGLQALGLGLFLIGLYADQKLDSSALPGSIRLVDRVLMAIADNERINLIMEWIDRRLGAVCIGLVLSLIVVTLIEGV